MTRSAGHLWTLLIACLAGVALLLAPAAAPVIRASLRDALVPGQRALAWLLHQGHAATLSVIARFTPTATHPDAEALRQSLASKDREVARLQIESAELLLQLSEERQRATAGLPTAVAAPLYQADLLTVHVLGTEAAGLWRSRPLLSGGTADGLRESALVLDDPRPIIDAGNDAQLHPDQPVFSGGTVLGKIVRVGRFSSTLCPVTDPTFAGSARLLRRTGTRVAFGAAGTLKGDGTGTCSLVRIPAEEPVGVGDLVITIDTDGLLPPQVYGEVVEADPPDGTLEWKIRVRPAARMSANTVQVLRTQLNGERIGRPVVSTVGSQ
jgi:hypothetical protein